MKTTEKEFDSVEMMRSIREKLRKELEGMNFEQQREFIQKRIANDPLLGADPDGDSTDSSR